MFWNLLHVHVARMHPGVRAREPEGGLYRISGRQLDTGPVSYTHLDVYKRQLYLFFIAQARAANSLGLAGSVLSGTPPHDSI